MSAKCPVCVVSPSPPFYSRFKSFLLLTSFPFPHLSLSLSSSSSSLLSLILFSCTKTVYFAERVSAAGKDYHKLCLRCTTCKKSLPPGDFADRDGRPYCKPCYNQAIGLKGYGFGQAGGGLESFESYGKGESTLIGGSPGAPLPEKAPSHGLPAPLPRGGSASFCSQCGTKAAGGAFCSSCGNKL